MPEQIQCQCAPCREEPWTDKWMGPMGATINGQYWCEWCLSCGCNQPVGLVPDGELIPNCSMERFGFPDEFVIDLTTAVKPAPITCEFCHVDYIVVHNDFGTTQDAMCSCQQDIQSLIEGSVES